VVRPGVVEYFSDGSGKKKKGSINLKQAELVKVVEDGYKKHPHTIELIGVDPDTKRRREYHFSASSRQHLDGWLRVLKNAMDPDVLSQAKKPRSATQPPTASARASDDFPAAESAAKGQTVSQVLAASKGSKVPTVVSTDESAAGPPDNLSLDGTASDTSSEMPPARLPTGVPPPQSVHSRSGANVYHRTQSLPISEMLRLNSMPIMTHISHDELDLAYQRVPSDVKAEPPKTATLEDAAADDGFVECPQCQYRISHSAFDLDLDSAGKRPPPYVSECWVPLKPSSGEEGPSPDFINTFPSGPGMPSGFTVHFLPHIGRVYYANHRERTTSFECPTSYVLPLGGPPLGQLVEFR
jgi:PH domain